MPIPIVKQAIKDVLEVLADAGGQAESGQIKKKLAEKWKLTLDEMALPDKFAGTAYVKQMYRAINILKREGKIIQSGRGVWRLSEVEPPVDLSPPKPDRHGELKQKMVEIGNELGYHASTEERGPLYQHDVLWKRGAYKKDPSHVIEICAGGSLQKDFDSLNWANQNVGAKGILVTVDGADCRKAMQRFENQPDIVVVKAETVDRLHELIMTNVQFLKLIFGEQF